MTVDRRWLVVAADGRHSTLGRASDPSQEEIERAAATMQGLTLASWLVISDGDYWRRGTPLELMVVRPLSEIPGATWEAARDAFLAARDAACA